MGSQGGVRRGRSNGLAGEGIRAAGGGFREEEAFLPRLGQVRYVTLSGISRDVVNVPAISVKIWLRFEVGWAVDWQLLEEL